ncbi:lipopolysaccharide transport system ATP-binding protein [Pantoea ananatis]|jgi:lipopolysaccharide transport system ATP-binding protein|uniref:ABC transporter ATP-binding protein n=1 Tax=Pantoea ananas TaxID=553 RepID=UPI0003B1FC6D|nr:ABC transporter ATP-binding protein [Pantoea ananatis]ERM12528.1 sugar ABC transporter ATP-binding protein [Pantoea ananatis BRT175]MCH9267948.1 ABC transporter ATP-binding protein [Pantoea ananatis]NEK83388.1 ABC transporter ATP-binding protein [Pantoea ananatis]RAR73404.1 lipopolysaccharide transport system ATP-binding protein [Pantoea ananatis]REF09989.1 lipopolysaccharide transport system ATP-binding protein [Pantoea ananatis]
MTIVKAENLFVEFPVYSSSQRSFKKILFTKKVGGGLNNNNGSVTVRALNNINFSIEEGDRVALIGHNGAGKTTLLRVLAEVYHPTSGTLSIKGNIVSLIDMAMGMDSEATGYQNIFIRGILLGLTLKEIKKNVDYIIEFSELGDYINLPVRTYSSGMLLRLAFSVISILKPSVLLMDEWLTVGDTSFKNKMGVKLEEMINDTSVLILASHSQEIIKKYCNRFFLLDNGTLTEISYDKVDEVVG